MTSPRMRLSERILRRRRNCAGHAAGVACGTAKPPRDGSEGPTARVNLSERVESGTPRVVVIVQRTCAAEVGAHLGPMPDPTGEASEPRLLDGLDPHELVVREALPGRGSLDVGGLADRTGLRVPTVLAALSSLEQQQLARRNPDGTWALARPPRR